MFSKRDILKLIIPMIIQNILTIMVGTFDSIMVSSAGEAAVSGVSLVGTVDTLLIYLFSSLVAGGAVTVSHALGSGDREYTKNSAKQLFYIATSIALIVGVTAFFVRRPLLCSVYANAEKEVIDNAIAYMGIMVLSFPMLAINETGASLLRVAGNTTVAMYLSFATNVINIIGNAILIYGCDMGVRGAAIATVIARGSYSVVITAILHKKTYEVHYERMWEYRPHLPTIKKILKIGIPHGVENSMFQVGRLITQVLISGMGTTAIAANSVANTLANYHYMPANALQSVSVTVVGRCYGAKEFEQAKKYARLLLWWAYLAMWAISLLLVIFVKPIANIYNLTPDGRKMAIMLTLFHCACVSTVRPLAFSLPSIFKASGDVKFSMFVSTFSMWAVRVGTAFILCLESVSVLGITIYGLNLGIIGVWVAMLGDWCVRALFYTPYFIKNMWLKNR